MADSYKIKKGDTLGAIAKKYNISVSELAVANNISNPNKIREGIIISIPKKKKEFSQSELKKVYKTNKPVYDTKDLYQGVDPSKIDNEKVVLDYMKGKEPFILIDKKTNTLRRYDAQGNEVANFRVGLGKDKGDKFTINSKNKKVDRNTSSAGIYIVDERDPKKESYAHDYENNILLLKNESGLRQAMSIHQTPRSSKKIRDAKILNTDLTDDDFSNGCINCTKEQYEQYLEVVKPGQKVIVLPEEEGNYFTVKGNKLSFTTNRDKEFGQYNFTPKNKEVTPFNLKSQKQTEYKQKYLDALSKEKVNLMKDLNLSNEEYDELAKRAYGIFGQESSFGEGSKNPLNDYRLEELYTTLFDKPEERQNRSLGLTQVRMKHVNPEFAEKYNIDTHSLYYPYQAAIATMERLTDAYQAVKNPKVRDKYRDMTPENVYDYAVTFYNKPETTRLGKASGKNQYVKQVKQFYSELEPNEEQNKMIAKKKHGGISDMGYKRNSPYKNKPFIDIDSNSITMEGVDFPVLALPDNDLPIIMEPGKNYLFPNSKKVREVPFQQGGTNTMSGLAGENTVPVSPFINLKPFINKYKLKHGGVIDYMATLPLEQQYQFATEFDSFDKETQAEIEEYLKGGYYQMGGVSEYPRGGQKNAELEDQETLITPNGELQKITGKKHKDGGEKVSLPEGTRIYSEHLKVDPKIASQVLGKETKKKYSYADLSKRFKTKPYLEILEDSEDEYQLEGARIKLANNLSKLDTLFYAQEQEKQMKENKTFKYGGLKKYQDAGEYPSPVSFYAGLLNLPNKGEKTGNLTTTGFLDLSEISNRFQSTDVPNVFNDPVSDRLFLRRSDGSYDYVGLLKDTAAKVVTNKSTDQKRYWQVQTEDDTWTPVYGKSKYGVPSPESPWTFFQTPNNEYVPQVPTDLKLVMPPRNEKIKEYELPEVVITDRRIKPKSKGKSVPSKSNAVPTVIEDNEWVVPLPLDTLPQRQPAINSITSSNPTTPLERDEQVADIVMKSNDDKNYPGVKSKWNFGISNKLAGTLADIGLAMSDKLTVKEPTLYNRQKTPLFTRFVDFDDQDVARTFSLRSQQIQNSNMPEQVKQAQLSALNSEYQDYQAKVDFANLQRYEQKRESDTAKLQQYADQNIDTKVEDMEFYNQRKANVDFLRDKFKAQRKARIVNALRGYADYADEVQYKNQLIPNYKVNPITGRIDYKPQDTSKLESNLLSQYQQSKPKIDLGGGAVGQQIGNVLVITDKDGKISTVQLND